MIKCGRTNPWIMVDQLFGDTSMTAATSWLPRMSLKTLSITLVIFVDKESLRQSWWLGRIAGSLLMLCILSHNEMMYSTGKDGSFSSASWINKS